MESVHFLQVLKTLSNYQINLNIIETAYIKDQEVQWMLKTSPEGKLSPGSSFPDLFELLSQHLSSGQLLVECVCLITHKYGKAWCSLSILRDIVFQKTELESISIVQKFHTEIGKFCSIDISYLNHEYQIKYHCKDKLLKVDSSYFDAYDLARTVVMAIEQSFLKRVIHVSFEFAVDTSGTAWLLNIPFCKLLEVSLSRDHTFRTLIDIQNGANYLPRKKHRYERKTLRVAKKQVKDYIFKGGRIRSKDSNLNSPLHMKTPMDVIDETSEISKKLKNNKVAQSARKLPSIQRKPFNSNFMEAVLKQFNKKKIIQYELEDSMANVKYKDFVSVLNLKSASKEVFNPPYIPTITTTRTRKKYDQKFKERLKRREMTLINKYFN